MRGRTWWRLTKGAGALLALFLVAVGAVGVWGWIDARWHPPPAPAPELARPVGKPKLTPAELRTQALELSPAERAELVAAFGFEPARNAAPTPSKARSRRGHAAPTPPVGASTPPAGSSPPSIDLGPWPRFLVRAEFGPGPRGDTGEALCYVPAEDAAAEVRIRWTTPPATLQEAAGCAAVRGAEAVEKAAEAAKDAVDQVAGKLGAEMRYSLRAGPGYGTGGPGLLLAGSIDGQTRKGWQVGGIGMLWLSADPAAAAAATVGLDRLLVGKD